MQSFLGRPVLKWEDLLDIPASISAFLRQHIVHIDAIDCDGYYLYAGSATESGGGATRIVTYERPRRAVDSDLQRSGRGQHLRIGLRPEAIMHLRIAMVFPIGSAFQVMLGKIAEALFVDLLQTIEYDYTNLYFTEEMAQDSMKCSPLDRSNGTQDWTGLNHVSPWCQPFSNGSSVPGRALHNQDHTYKACPGRFPNLPMLSWRWMKCPILAGYVCLRCNESWRRLVKKNAQLTGDSIKQKREVSLPAWIDVDARSRSCELRVSASAEWTWWRTLRSTATLVRCARSSRCHFVSALWS